MAAPIQFYFDFVSTYSYIAVHKIDEMAARHGRTVEWNAVSLGHIFQAIGVTPPPMIPGKFAYNVIDFPRSCAFAGLACQMPKTFPFDPKLARYAFWSLKAQDDRLARDYTRAVMRHVFGAGGTVATPAEIAAACADIPGLDEAAIATATTDSAAKRAVVAAMDRARADGMIGAPFMVLDGEPFWGVDRFDQMEWRLATKAQATKA